MQGITRSAAILWAAMVASGVAAETPLQYNRDIRPILADHCFTCHGPDSAARKADLRLDQRQAAIDMGAIVPGDPDESELLARLLTDDEDLVMPPPELKKPLKAEQKELLKRWIEAGAEYQRHWSFMPPQKPQPPADGDSWAKNPIDRFVLARLQAAGLQPAPEADPRVLFRRLSLDIRGLPPTPQETDAFVADYRKRGDAALSEWVDKLMESPAWGEHRARYWLDAARYGDTHGLHFDNYREMWPYRDWVIRAFNANQPFDRFAVEQIAGDLLPEATDAQRIATGFQRCNMTTNEGGTIDEENLALYAADRVQTFGWVFLGLTTNCGQCHDHKFDPFTMKDYYSLAAYFRNTTQGAKDGNVKDGRGPVLIVPSEADRPRWQALPKEIAVATQRRDDRKRAARQAFQKWLASAQPDSIDREVARDGLLVHLPLNEGQGSRVRASGDKPLEFSGTGEIQWKPGGKLGPAPVMKLGGTIDLGDLGDFEKDQAFSCAAWIRPGQKDVSGGIIARMDERGDYRGWDVWQQGLSLAVHLIDTWPDNAIKVATAKPVLKVGQWQHVVATYDGSGQPGGVAIYVDGSAVPLRVEKNSLQPGATFRTQTPLRIGQRSHTQVFEGGAIQDVRLYARILDASEAKTLQSIAPLAAILSVAPEKRSPQQQTALYEHYLAMRDAEYPALSDTVRKLESEREAIRARSPITHVQEERKDSPAMAHILTRGEYDRPGDKVAAATPAALHPLPPGAPANRLGLARWLIDPANPLTARVTVNRYWQQIFGRGLVVTPEDFGVMGALPSHPELLDWLAVDFQQHGWDVKRLFKLMLTSAAYRQSAEATNQQAGVRRRQHSAFARSAVSHGCRDGARLCPGRQRLAGFPDVRARREALSARGDLGCRGSAGRQYPRNYVQDTGPGLAPPHDLLVLETDGAAAQPGGAQCAQPGSLHCAARADQYAAASSGHAE